VSRPRTAELLAAYAAGGELTDEERGAVEALLAQSADARDDLAATRALLDDLRAAAPEPPPATEAMVRAVRLACAEPEPWPSRARAWLRRRWAFAIPVVAAAVVLVVIGSMMQDPAEDPTPPHAAAPPPSPPPGPVAIAPSPPGAPPAVWLDGAATALDALDPAAAAAIDDALGEELAGISDDTGLDEEDPEIGLGLGLGLGTADLGWVDQLDDDTAAELDRWLGEQPS
jgi:hypothetical protein